MLISYIRDFVAEIKQGNIEVYNEAGIQYELAIYLRLKLSNDFKIQLERNIEYFGFKQPNYSKKEMDIVIFSSNKKEKHCIELKYPTNGQYPEQMFSACKDISFLEQLIEVGFDSSYFLMFSEDTLFYGDKGDEGIYLKFRKNKLIEGMIKKPTGNSKEKIQIKSKYKIEWQTIKDNLKYFIVEVK